MTVTPHHRIHIALLALLCCLWGPAQAAQEHWQSFDATDGLPGGMVRVIIQDRTGALWLGTMGGGVTRYDGLSWTTFTTRDGLASNLVSSIIQDGDDVFWIGTGNGLSRYDGTAWTTFTTDDGLAGNDVRAVVQSRDGAFWIGTGNGLNRYDGSEWTTFTTGDGLADNDIRTIVQDQAGALWVGTGNGVSRYDGAGWETHTRETTDERLANNGIRSMLVDRDGNVWVGTDSWVSRYDGQAWVKFSVLNGVIDYEINTILQDEAGRIWVGTRGDIGVYDGQVWTSLTADDGLIHNTVTAGFQDREGLYWFGATGGISCYSGEVWTTYTTADGRAHNDISAVARDRAGVYWFGTPEGVSRYDGRRWTTVTRADGLASNLVSSIIVDRQGAVWAGTNGGVSRYDGRRWTSFNTTHGLIDNGVRTVYQDRAGDLWFGANGGVSRYNGGTWTSITPKDGLVGIGVNAIVEDRSGQFWFGTDTGASRYDGDRWTSFTTTNGLAHNTVRAIASDSSGVLWFATPAGVSRYENTLWRSYRSNDGLADNWTWSALTDRSGDLWFGAWNGGVSRYDGAVFQVMTGLDGLAGNRVQTVFQDRDEAIWFGTSDGVSRYRAPAPAQPNVVIDAVVTDDRYVGIESLDMASSIGLVMFEFHGVSLKTRPEALVYRYRLRGHEADWRNTVDRRVEYQDLPRGDYTFEVQAVDRDLVYSAAPANLALQVHLPYERIGWISALVIAIILIAWQTGRVVSRDRKLQYVNQALLHANTNLNEANYSLEKKSVDLEQVNTALGDANEQIQEADRLKSQFLANMSHELRTPLNAIIGFTGLVMRRSGEALPERQKDNLNKVQESGKHLLRLIDEILDLSKIEAGRIEIQPGPFAVAKFISGCCATVNSLVKSGVTLQHEVAPELDQAHSDDAKLSQILINLLSNAAKFTEHGRIRVRATLEPGDIMAIAVSDTGIGIPPEALGHIFEEFRQVDGTTSRKYGGTGLGLAITKKLSNLLGGDINVESEVGKGSTFTVRIPRDIQQPVEATPEAETPVVEQPIRSAREESQEKPPDTPSDETAADRPLMLAIDDDPNAMKLLQEELGEAGYRVVGASDKVDGFLKARELQPFAVTVDILMPEKDGWAAIALLKADPQTRDIPIIITSIVDDRAMGTRLGVADYLVKPVDRDSLLSALHRLRAQNITRVHIIDDNPNDGSLLRQLLEGEGFQVHVAAGGADGLAALERERPDILLLDLMMPEMDGFAVLERLQENEDWRSIPVIVVTAKDLTAEERTYLQERTRGIVPKTGLDHMTLIQAVQGAKATNP